MLKQTKLSHSNAIYIAKWVHKKLKLAISSRKIKPKVIWWCQKKTSDYVQLNFHIVISRIILYLLFRFRTRTD